MAKAAPTAPLLADQAEQLASVEEMIAALKDLRQQAGDRALLGAYQAAIDRLDALAYRLAEVGSAPAPAPAAANATALDPAPSPPQAALPLGPVIVVALKPAALMNGSGWCIANWFVIAGLAVTLVGAPCPFPVSP